MENNRCEYGFLTLLIPRQLEKSVAELSTGNMQDAANALQWHIYDGLCANLKQSIRLFNVLPIGSFPQYYKKAFVQKSTFATPQSPDNVNIGFCNVKLLRKYIISRKVYGSLRHWCKESDSPKTLFVYTITPPFIVAIEKLKKEFPKLRACSIVADLPNMTNLSCKRSLAEKLFNKHMTENTFDKLYCVDFFVLLSKHMADYMKIHQPFCVMEGISTQIQSEEVKPEYDGLKRILYSGTLHRKYGILNLLEAFHAIPDKNYRLSICGIGDSEEKVRAAAVQDDRITYLGQLPREKVIRLQLKTDVLVNPRQNNEEFTKYSFPSKNLEYLSTGKPLVAYKLDGIPDEYDSYIFYVKDNTIEALKNELMYVCENKDGTVKSKAELARIFVRDEKNEVIQTKRICDFFTFEMVTLNGS